MRRLVVVLGVLLVLALGHRPVLGAAGEVLVAREPLGPADAIVVLAGNSPYRAQHAEALYRDGLARHVIVSNEPLSSHGVRTTWIELRAAGLVRLAIPDEAIVPIEAIADSTYDEALSTRDIMLARGWRTAIVVTDPFHMRRALLTFRQAFEPAGLVALPSPADESKYGVDNWWQDRNATMRVLQEYLKLGYYLAIGRV